MKLLLSLRGFPLKRLIL